MSLEQLSKIYTHKHRYIHKEMMGENKAYTYMGQLFSSCVLRKLPKKKNSNNNLKREKQQKYLALATKLKTATAQKQIKRKRKAIAKYQQSERKRYKQALKCQYMAKMPEENRIKPSITKRRTQKGTTKTWQNKNS